MQDLLRQNKGEIMNRIWPVTMTTIENFITLIELLISRVTKVHFTEENLT